MTNIKLPHLDKHFRQLVLLNHELEFVRSNDLIFSTEKIKNISVEKWFPFIESIFSNIKNIEKSDEELIFSRVESPSEFLPGSYDFVFKKLEIEGVDYIQWCIYDYTSVYAYLSKYQQLKNEKDIFRQKLEYRNKKAKNIDDLFL